MSLRAHHPRFGDALSKERRCSHSIPYHESDREEAAEFNTGR